MKRTGLPCVLALLAIGAICCAAGPAPTAQSRPASRPAEPATQGDKLARAQRARIVKLHRRTIELAKAGKYDQCEPILRRILALDDGDNLAWYNLACVHARLGRKRQALESLNKAIENGYGALLHMTRDSDLDSIRNTPEYKAILARREEIQRSRAEKIRATLQKRFGPGYICQIDHERKLVFATNVDRQTLAELKLYLTAHAEGLWKDLFAHRFEQYVTVLIPRTWPGGVTLPTTYAAGYYNHAQRMLLARNIGMVLAHEFTHALHAADMEGLGQRHPIWALEGLATLYESSRVVEGSLVPEPNRRLALLQYLIRRKQTIPFKKLFGYSHGDFMGNAMAAYPQARYVMMYLHQQGKLKAWYEAYTGGYEQEKTGAAAMEKVLGKPLAEVEADWLAWVRKLKPPPRSLPAKHAYIGVSVAGLADGLRIRRVVPGSGADNAGLGVGDVIVSLDGQRVMDPGKLLRIVDKHKVGDKIKIRYRRDGQYRTAAVTLGAMPERLAPPWARSRPATRPARKAG